MSEMNHTDYWGVYRRGSMIEDEQFCRLLFLCPRELTKKELYDIWMKEGGDHIYCCKWGTKVMLPEEYKESGGARYHAEQRALRRQWIREQVLIKHGQTVRKPVKRTQHYGDEHFYYWRGW